MLSVGIGQGLQPAAHSEYRVVEVLFCLDSASWEVLPLEISLHNIRGRATGTEQDSDAAAVQRHCFGVLLLASIVSSAYLGERGDPY